jgi:hypothetical protein
MATAVGQGAAWGGPSRPAIPSRGQLPDRQEAGARPSRNRSHMTSVPNEARARRRRRRRSLECGGNRIEGEQPAGRIELTEGDGSACAWALSTVGGASCHDLGGAPGHRSGSMPRRVHIVDCPLVCHDLDHCVPRLFSGSDPLPRLSRLARRFAWGLMGGGCQPENALMLDEADDTITVTFDGGYAPPKSAMSPHRANRLDA